jgi:hypothetical protein
MLGLDDHSAPKGFRGPILRSHLGDYQGSRRLSHRGEVGIGPVWVRPVFALSISTLGERYQPVHERLWPLRKGGAIHRPEMWQIDSDAALDRAHRLWSG